MDVTIPGDEILFALTSDQTDEITICSALQRADVRIETLICEPNALPNPKVSKLAQIEGHARNDIRLLLDSEADLDLDLLEALLEKLTDQTAVTALYGFPSTRNSVQLVDSLNSSCFLWAGTSWTRQFGQQQFAFGACILFRKNHLEQIGGWQRLGEFLAEDFHFGKLLANHGVRIELADLPLRLESDALSWAAYFRHQLRVALTYRVTNSIGYFGSIVVQAFPILLLSLLSNPAVGILLFLPLILFRGLIHHQILQRLNVQMATWKILLITPICLVTETVTWLLSWFSSSVRWGKQRYKITREGTIVQEHS